MLQTIKRKGIDMRKKLAVEIKRAQIGLITDIVYSQKPYWYENSIKSLHLNLMKPRGKNPYPVIIWLCGGAWKMMDKDYHMPEMVYLAEHGFAVASVEYRMTNEAQFPGQIEDVKEAIRFLRAHSKDFCLNPEKFGIMGESAGGYLAVLAGTTGETTIFDKGSNLEYSSRVQAVCDWYGPIDFIDFARENNGYPASPEALLLGGAADVNQEIALQANPCTYLTPQTPPMMILHGNEDDTVPFRQSEQLYEQLCSNGTPVEFYELEKAGHADRHFVQPQIRELILNFFQKNLVVSV